MVSTYIKHKTALYINFSINIVYQIEYQLQPEKSNIQLKLQPIK